MLTLHFALLSARIVALRKAGGFREDGKRQHGDDGGGGRKKNAVMEFSNVFLAYWCLTSVNLASRTSFRSSARRAGQARR
jgi:hypothetical protein